MNHDRQTKCWESSTRSPAAGGPIALAFVLAELLGVKLNVGRNLIRRVTMVRIGIGRRADDGRSPQI